MRRGNDYKNASMPLPCPRTNKSLFIVGPIQLLANIKSSKIFEKPDSYLGRAKWISILMADEQVQIVIINKCSATACNNFIQYFPKNCIRPVWILEQI